MRSLRKRYWQMTDQELYQEVRTARHEFREVEKTYEVKQRYDRTAGESREVGGWSSADASRCSEARLRFTTARAVARIKVVNQGKGNPRSHEQLRAIEGIEAPKRVDRQEAGLRRRRNNRY